MESGVHGVLRAAILPYNHEDDFPVNFPMVFLRSAVSAVAVHLSSTP